MSDSLIPIADELVVQRLGWMLLHFVWQGTVVAAALWIILTTLRRRSSNVRYLAALAALAFMAACPPITFMCLSRIGSETAVSNEEVSGWRADGRRNELSTATVNTGTTSVQLEVAPPTGDSTSSDEDQSSNSLQVAASAGGLKQSDTVAMGSLFQRLLHGQISAFLPWIVTAWFAGVTLLSLRLLVCWCAAEQVRRRASRPAGRELESILTRLRARMGVRRSVRLLMSSLVPVASVVGWLRPVILLPFGTLAGLTPQQLEAVLAHELAHIRRYDYIVNLLQSFVETLLFYHPAVWWLSRQVRTERESCCDDLAAEVVGDRIAYAKALVQVAEAGLKAPRLSPAANGGELLTRIERLLGRPGSATVGSPGYLGLVIPLILASAMLMVGSLSSDKVVPQALSGQAEPEEVRSVVDSARAERDVTTRVRELIYILRHHRVFERTDEWASAIRELVKIGKLAVPELVAELDSTNRDATLRALGFTLRAIDDPRAVPGLIRAIPKALQPPGSDCGLRVIDPKLMQFMLEHDRSPNVRPFEENFSYGRPVNEILGALTQITGHDEPADGGRDPLRHLFWSGTAAERANKLNRFRERQVAWEIWWSDHWHEFCTEQELRSVELPARERDLVEEAGLARFGPHFPTGIHVRLGPVREVALAGTNHIDAESYLDLDTGRRFQPREGIDPEWVQDASNNAERRWQQTSGVDVRVRTGIDLHLWLIDGSRWESIEDEIRSGRPIEFGREARSLTPFGDDSKDSRPNEVGTFLFTTREGGRGILQSLPRHEDSSTYPFRYRLWEDERNEEETNSVAERKARSVRNPDNWQEAVTTVTLQSPGPGKSFLLDLETGRVITPPAEFVVAYADTFTLGQDDEVAKWCRNQGIDIATQVSAVIYEGGTPGNRPTQVITLSGLDMDAQPVASQSFEQMSIETIRELWSRWPQRREFASMNPLNDLESGEPSTFIISTLSGRRGLLQILSTSKDMTSITFRYQLAKSAM